MKSTFKIFFFLLTTLIVNTTFAQSTAYRDLFVRWDLSPSAGSDTTRMYFQMLVNVDTIYSGTNLNLMIGSQQDSSDAASFIIPATVSGGQQYYTFGSANYYVSHHFLSISFSLPKSILGVVDYMTLYSVNSSTILNSNKLYYKF